MSAPPAALIDARHHGANHADKRQQSNHWEEPAEDDVSDDNPVERNPWSFKMSVESFLYHYLSDMKSKAKIQHYS